MFATLRETVTDRAPMLGWILALLPDAAIIALLPDLTGTDLFDPFAHEEHRP